ncbi:zinc finger CCHC domain-containing protein 3-like [Xenopus tropicalis]|uniref:Zinc finger CCHC domain-containing protein 3-like n=1 Tax=Xenopus tropicalis TaxID=8364 RepID=A0A8J1JQ01_XENTR|nr:zinc finger CCHC domain-containing protein 3-like [Xenopus tropicalis]
MAATDGESIPVFIRVKNSVRILAADLLNAEKGLAYIVQVILEELGRVSRREILAIQDYPRKGVYDVTFDGEGVYRSFLSILGENLADPRLSGFKVVPHFAEEEVFLIVKSYSPFVPLKEIETVISRYCKKLVFVGKVLNELGIWTSKYRFKAVFEKGTFPPARFRLGTVNIDCFFKGMPEFCRRCRQYGHVSEGCTACQNCGKTGHEVMNCVLPKKCNFCLQEGHLYVRCPQRKVEPVEVSADLGELRVPVDLTPRSSGEEALAVTESQEGPAVKRKKEKEKKEKKKKPEKPEKQDVSSGMESSSSTNVPSPTRGQRLFKFYDCRSDRILQEALSDWPYKEEYEEMVETCIRDQPADMVRFRLLNYISQLK